MKKSAVRAYQKTTHDWEAGNNDSLSHLMQAWNDAEDTMGRIYEHEAAGAVSLHTDEALRTRFERRLRSIEARQSWLIERMAEVPSKSINDVLNKFVLWRSMNGALQGDEQDLTVTERLISGAIADLEAFVAGAQPAAVEQA